MKNVSIKKNYMSVLYWNIYATELYTRRTPFGIRIAGEDIL